MLFRKKYATCVNGKGMDMLNNLGLKLCKKCNLRWNPSDKLYCVSCGGKL